jgi:hypothetical protein
MLPEERQMEMEWHKKSVYRLICHSFSLYCFIIKLKGFINIIIFALAVHIWNTVLNINHVLMAL